MSDPIPFSRLVEQCRAKRKLPAWTEDIRVLALDPGHTTGFAIFEGMNLFKAGQIKTDTIEHAVEGLSQAALYVRGPDMMVIEDYRVYKWRAMHHAGSELLTVRIIGIAETLAVQKQIPVHKQAAHIAKGFCTDQRLKGWDFWQGGYEHRHANDAIRHGVYFILFGPLNIRKRNTPTVG